MPLFGHIHAGPGLILLIAAGITLYIASRAAADALVGGRLPSPGRMALGHWIPIAAVALAAMVLRRSEVALGVLFATSVASLSLAAGSVVLIAPPAVPPVARRTWPMILPAALLAFMAGLRGEFTQWHAIVFAAEGLAVAVLWNDRGRGEPIAVTAEAPPEVAAQPRRRWWHFSPLRSVQFVLAVALAGIGAWCAVHGADVGSESTRVYTEVRVASAGLVAATLLGPLLVLPMLGTGVDLAHRGQSWLAVSSFVGVVLLNVCLLLPAVIIEAQYHPLRDGVSEATAWLDQNVWPSWRTTMAAPMVASPTTTPATLPAGWVSTAPTTSPTTASSAAAAAKASPSSTADDEDQLAADAPHDAVPLPLAVWRVDIVVLIALGLFLVPVALGRWTMTKWEGLGLLAGYIAYLLLAMTLGVRLV